MAKTENHEAILEEPRREFEIFTTMMIRASLSSPLVHDSFIAQDSHKMGKWTMLFT